MTSVQDTLQTFVDCSQSVLSKIVIHDDACHLKVGDVKHAVQVPTGQRGLVRGGHDAEPKKYVDIAYHDNLLGELLLSHAVHDFCIIGP